MRRPLLLALALLLAAPPAAAEAPVARVRVVAAGLDDPAAVLHALGLAAGQPLDRARLRRGVQVLFAGGEVEHLRVDSRAAPDGLEVEVHLNLRPRIARVELEASGLRRRARQRDWVELRPGMLLAEGDVEDWAGRLERRLVDHGYARARVEPFIDLERASNTAVVTFRVTPGEAEVVAAVTVAGAPGGASLLDLDRHLGKRLSSSRVESIRREVEAGLRRHGHWEGVVTSVARRDLGGAQAAVDLEVQPGPHYRLDLVAPPGEEGLVGAAVPDPVEEDLHPAQTDALAERVRQALQGKGHLLARVRAALDGSGGERTLRLEVVPGPRQRLEAVDLPGAVSMRRKKLDAAIAAHRGRVGGWRGQRVTAATLEGDRLAVEDLYRRAGFLEVEVGAPRLEPVDGQRVRVVMPVEEGQRWLLADLRLEGFPVEVAGTLDVALEGLEEAGPFDPRAVEPTRRTLELALADAGFPDARVTASVDTAEAGAARVTLAAEPGPFVRLGEVVVAGLGRTRPAVVRRELDRAGVAPGEPLARAALAEAQRSLAELGLFRRLEMTPIPGQETGSERSLAVRCEEGPQRSYLLGLGWDTEDGVRATLGWSHLNLWGGAHAVSAETRLSGREVRFQVSLHEPLLPGLGLPGFAAVYRTEEDYTSFSQLRRGLWLEVGDRRARPVRSWLRYEYQIVRPDAPPEILSELEREEQQIQVASLTPALEWDRRDDPLRPSRGLLASASLEWAFPVFSADARFLKLETALSVYGEVANGTGAVGLRVGALRPIAAGGDEPANLEVPLATRFFAGGRTTHRSFATDLLGIEGQTLDDGEPVGGAALLLLNLEYRRSLRGDLSAVLFADTGNVWAEIGAVGWDDLRWGAGLGLRYDTPAGPLRLEYGWKLDREPGESGGQLYLSFGSPF